ncbi:hypothetical protein VTG60DRAFT_4062 [Thermothelomyces hinnuleus]
MVITEQFESLTSHIQVTKAQTLSCAAISMNMEALGGALGAYFLARFIIEMAAYSTGFESCPAPVVIEYGKDTPLLDIMTAFSMV